MTAEDSGSFRKMTEDGGSTYYNRVFSGRAEVMRITGVEEKRCLLHGQVDVVVVGELRQGEECVPVVLSFSNEDLQVLFQFLVDPFRLSVCLRVVGGRRRGFDF